jgi:polyhydroxyalkanoate synthesis regulator phasin
MSLEERVARLEASRGKDDEMVRELRDAVTATAYMEAAHSRAMKDHAVWLVAHDEAIVAQRQQMKELGERIDQLGERIDKLVSGIGEFIRQRQN